MKLSIHIMLPHFILVHVVRWLPNLILYTLTLKANSEAWIGEFTLLKPDENDFILPTGLFAKQLKSFQCNDASISVTFNSSDCFEYIADVWDWVNQQGSRKFTLVTEPGMCDADKVRTPHHVTEIAFQNNTLSAVLRSTRSTWEEVAEDFDFSTRHSYLNTNKTSGKMSRKTRRQDKTQTEDVSEGPYEKDMLNEKVNSVEKLAVDTADIANNNGTNGTTVGEMEQNVKTTMEAAVSYILDKAKSALQSIVDDNDDADLVKTAQDALLKYNEHSKAAEAKYAEADSAQDDDTREQAISDALMHDDEAAETMITALDQISLSLDGETADNSTTSTGNSTLSRRFLHVLRADKDEKATPKSTANSWLTAIKNNWNALKRVANAVIMIYEFIASDGPSNLSWKEHWAPTLYKTDVKTQIDLGMTFEAKAEIDTAGTLVGQVDLGFRKRKISQYNIDLTPEDVWASVQLSLSASGTLKKPLDVVPISQSIPLGTWQGQKIEIFGNNVITIGPFLNVSLHAGFDTLKGKGSAKFGFRGDVPNESRLLLAGDENIANNVTGWIPKFTTVGPSVQSSLEGQLRMAVVLATTFEATVFGQGANVTLTADVPSAGVAFRPQACDDKKKTKGIGLRPYLGINMVASAAANAEAWALKPKFSKTVYTSRWELLRDDESICIPLHNYEGDIGKDPADGEDLPAYDDDSPPPYSETAPFDDDDAFFELV